MPTNRLEINSIFNEAAATFGDRLVAAREAKGLSVAGLAEKIGVDVRRVAGWESNSDEPRGNLTQMLAGLLNVSLVWLISGESNGTTEVVDRYERTPGVNDALGEISRLTATLSSALIRLEKLEKRLLEVV